MTNISTDASAGAARKAAENCTFPLVVRAGQANPRTYKIMGDGVSGACLVGAEETGGVFSLFEITAEPGGVISPHRHSTEEETFYILEGNFEVQRGGELIEMSAGMALHGPRGVIHGLRCVGDVTGRILIVTIPGGFENYYREMNESEGAADLAFLMGKYGLQAGPEPIQPSHYSHLAPNRFVGLRDHRGHVLVSSDETDGVLVLAGLEVDPKGGLQPHLHRLEEEIFYVLEGQFRIMLADQVIDALPGDFVFAPRGTVHSWSNVGDAPAYALVLIAPAENFQNFSLEMEKLVARIGEDVPDREVDPALLQEIKGVYQRHSIELSEFGQP